MSYSEADFDERCEDIQELVENVRKDVDGVSHVLGRILEGESDASMESLEQILFEGQETLDDCWSTMSKMEDTHGFCNDDLESLIHDVEKYLECVNRSVT